MIHPDTELRPAGETGLGVFVTQDIPKGTIMWVLDDFDQRLTLSRVDRLVPTLKLVIDRYAYQGPLSELILCWDHARFVNHSCRPNVLSTGWDFDVAIEDIRAGDQLTNDYACLNLDEPFECLCRSPGCRGTIRDEDFELHADGWDAAVADAFSRIWTLPQPLWPLLPNPVELQQVLARRADPPSIRRHRRTRPPLRDALAHPA